MVKKIFILAVFFICISTATHSQVQILSTDISSVTDAGEGDYYLTSDTNELYVGMSTGLLKPVGKVTANGTTNGEILTWNSTTNKWEPQGPTDAGLTLSRSTIRSIDRARFTIRPETNINTGTFTITPNTVELNQTSGVISTTNATELTGFEGNLRFIIQPYLSSSAERTNFICNFNVNGSINKSQATSLYARSLNGHNQTGTSIVFEYENANPTNTFSFSFTREANIGPVALISSNISTSYIFVEQYSDIEVITNVAAPVNLEIAQGPAGLDGEIGPAGPVGPAGPAISSPTDVYHAAGNIMSNGVPNYEQGVDTITQLGIGLGTGRYRIRFDNPHPNGDNYPILFSIEQNTGLDDYVPAYTNVSAMGFDVQIGEQDNGGTGGVPVNSAFSFYVPF